MKKALVLIAILLSFTVHGLAIERANARARQVGEVACPASIPLGEVFDCALGVVGEEDEYTYAGSTNDQLKLRVLRTSGVFWPQVRTYDPSNVLVNSCSTWASNGLVLINCSLTSSGTYKIRIRDYRGTDTGDYKVYAQRMNDVGNALPIAFGQTVTGALNSPIQSDTFVLNAQINDKLYLRLARTSGAIWPQLRVHDGAGNLVTECSSWTSDAFVLKTCSVTTSGVHSVLIDDYRSAATGTYSLHLQRFNLPGNPTDISFGVPASGALSESAELDVFRFNVEANDLLLIRLLRTSGGIWPWFRLFDQDGVLVCGQWGSSALADDDACAIAKTGTYGLFVEDYQTGGTGDYTLHLQRINNPGNPLSIAFAQTINDSIASVAAVDTYTFQATQADKLRMKMTRTSGAFWPRIRIYTSGGQLLCSTYSSNATAETSDCNIPVTGTYVALIEDYQKAGVGTYTLTLMCVSGSCASVGKTFVYAPLVRR